MITWKLFVDNDKKERDSGTDANNYQTLANVIAQTSGADNTWGFLAVSHVKAFIDFAIQNKVYLALRHTGIDSVNRIEKGYACRTQDISMPTITKRRIDDEKAKISRARNIKTGQCCYTPPNAIGNGQKPYPQQPCPTQLDGLPTNLGLTLGLSADTQLQFQQLLKLVEAGLNQVTSGHYGLIGAWGELTVQSSDSPDEITIGVPIGVLRVGPLKGTRAQKYGVLVSLEDVTTDWPADAYTDAYTLEPIYLTDGTNDLSDQTGVQDLVSLCQTLVQALQRKRNIVQNNNTSKLERDQYADPIPRAPQASYPMDSAVQTGRRVNSAIAKGGQAHAPSLPRHQAQLQAATDPFPRLLIAPNLNQNPVAQVIIFVWRDENAYSQGISLIWQQVTARANKKIEEAEKTVEPADRKSVGWAYQSFNDAKAPAAGALHARILNLGLATTKLYTVLSLLVEIDKTIKEISTAKLPQHFASQQTTWLNNLGELKVKMNAPDCNIQALDDSRAKYKKDLDTLQTELTAARASGTAAVLFLFDKNLLLDATSRLPKPFDAAALTSIFGVDHISKFKDAIIAYTKTCGVMTLAEFNSQFEGQNGQMKVLKLKNGYHISVPIHQTSAQTVIVQNGVHVTDELSRWNPVRYNFNLIPMNCSAGWTGVQLLPSQPQGTQFDQIAVSLIGQNKSKFNCG